MVSTKVAAKELGLYEEQLIEWFQDGNKKLEGSFLNYTITEEDYDELFRGRANGYTRSELYSLPEAAELLNVPVKELRSKIRGSWIQSLAIRCVGPGSPPQIARWYFPKEEIDKHV